MSGREMVGGPDNVRAFKEAMMATGTVKWFNPTKGYGLIQPKDGGRAVSSTKEFRCTLAASLLEFV